MGNKLLSKVAAYFVGTLALLIPLIPFGFIGSGFLIGVVQERARNATWNNDAWINVSLWTLSGLTAEFIFRQI